jgi:transcriptional regulator with XRE-family HTH domain
MENLKKLREKKGLSQQKLADVFNLSQQSIYKYENDISDPNLDTLKDFADYFDTSVDYLVGHTDIPQKITEYKEFDLNKTEQQHMLQYRRLSASQQLALDTFLKSMLQ